MDSLEGFNGFGDCVWAVDDVNVCLLHAVMMDEALPEGKKRASFSKIFSLASKRKKDVKWFYSVAADYVIIRAGKVVFKSRIHNSKGFNFIRVPRLGLVLVEGNSLRKPLSGEAALMGKKFG